MGGESSPPDTGSENIAELVEDAAMEYLAHPSADEVSSLMGRARRDFPKKPVVILVGVCTVEYSGRAKSFLGAGERVVIIKPDGVVLVHRVGGRDPINWQPPGTSLSWWTEGDDFIVEAVHRKREERMVIRFSSISMVLTKVLRDSGDFSIVGMEKDLVDAIVENPSLLEEGLQVVKREYPLASGFADILCRDRDGRYVIVEVKRSAAGPSAASQLLAYVRDVRQKNPGTDVRGLLVAPRIQPTAKKLLETEGLEYREMEVPRSELPRNQLTMDSFM